MTDHAANDLPRLDHEIAYLEELHALRTTVVGLRRAGLRQVTNLVAADRDLEPSPTPSTGVGHSTAARDAGGAGGVHTAAASTDLRSYWIPSADAADTPTLARALEFSPEHQELHKWLLSKLELLTVETLRIPGSAAANCADSAVPALLAARTLCTFARQPGHAFKPSALFAYYAVVRELFTVAGPEWAFGGARVRPDSTCTAFMTGECCKAITLVAVGLNATSRLFAMLADLYERESRISIAPHLPKRWTEQEVRRLRLSAYTRISEEMRTAVVLLHDSAVLGLRDATKPLHEAMRSMVLSLLDQVRAIENGSHEATESIRNFEHDEDKRVLVRVSKDLEEIVSARLGAERKIALHAVRRVGTVATRCLQRLRSIDDSLKGVPNALALCSSLRELGEILRAESKEVRRLLEPSKRFAEGVLNGQLAAHGLGDGSLWDPAEMAFAACTVGYLERWADDARIRRAMELLSGHLPFDGHIATQLSLHTDPRGYSLTPVTGEVHHALAQMLEHFADRWPASERSKLPAVFRKMVRFFEDTAVRTTDGGDVVGWSHERPARARLAYRWVSALNVVALSRIERALDIVINAWIYDHFSTKRPGDRPGRRRLHQVFYPDYGLAQLDGSIAGERAGHSIAEYLERMRAHVRGVPLGLAYPQACYSLILHGPPGTGKTTMAECLAESCRVTLVEVTPSDIVVGGQDMIERRTRVVFKALSMLTSTVVLFDEFDPVLRARDPKDSRTPTVFSFLTPGILPKLRDLHDHAKGGRVAFILATNLVETLDDAAIRTGRFDHRIPLFPPDPLSRTGRLLLELSVYWSPRGDCNALFAKHSGSIVELIKQTRFSSIGFLSAEGNFTAPSDNEAAPYGTIMNAVERGDIVGVRVPEREARIPPDRITNIETGRHRTGLSEVAQWRWLKFEEERVAACNTLDELSEVLAVSPPFPPSGKAATDWDPVFDV